MYEGIGKTVADSNQEKSQARKAVKDAFQILNRIDGGIVLDAATGRGEFINVLKQYLKSYVQIIGVDSSEKSVEYAQKVFPENSVEIYRMNLEQLAFGDKHFDTVCVSNSLHHFENPEKVFAEMYRVLKPGGNLIFTEMYQDGMQSPAQTTHIMMHHWVAKVDTLSGIYHRQTFCKQEIEDFSRALGFSSIQIEDFYTPVDDPKAAKTCANLLKNCQDTMKRLESMKDTDDLIQEGKKIIVRINEVGCASASRLLIIGRK